MGWNLFFLYFFHTNVNFLCKSLPYKKIKFGLLEYYVICLTSLIYILLRDFLSRKTSKPQLLCFLSFKIRLSHFSFFQTVSLSLSLFLSFITQPNFYLYLFRINEEIQCDAISGEESLVCPFRKLLFNLHKEIPDNDLNRMRSALLNIL